VLGDEDRAKRVGLQPVADRPQAAVGTDEQKVDAIGRELIANLEHRAAQLPRSDRLAHLRQDTTRDIAQRTQRLVLVEAAQHDEQGATHAEDDRERQQRERAKEPATERAGDHSAALASASGPLAAASGAVVAPSASASAGGGTGSRRGGTIR